MLDGSGSFFATIQLEPGPNQVTISAQEACGPTVLEIELMGAGDDTDPWAGFSEVSDLLQARFSATTFDQAGQRLLVDVAADNPGAALQGPILVAVGVDMHPGVSLLNSDGQTPNGEPYVILVPEGEMLPAGGLSATRRLVFSNPGLESIDFEPRWLLPANQAPHFTTGPVNPGNGRQRLALCRCSRGREWRQCDLFPAGRAGGDESGGRGAELDPGERGLVRCRTARVRRSRRSGSPVVLHKCG